MSCSCDLLETGCSSISGVPYLNMEVGGFTGGGGVLQCVSRLIFCAVSRALVAFFAIGGAFAGAIAGGLAGRVSNCGVFRGAGLGALAGAFLSVEVLEASRAYWCLQQSASRPSSAMADFIEELLRRRFVEDDFTPAMLTAYRWQVSIADVSYEEIHNAFGGVACGGLSGDSLRKLPCHVLIEEIKPDQNICCAICLQDITVGETARSLPTCKHTFHLVCVDKWLTRHRSCPVCRRDV